MAKKRKRGRRWWTVMLLYPDYLTDDYGSDTYVGWACKATPEEAVPAVRRQAVEAQRDLSKEASVDMDEDDFKLLAVWRGRSTLALGAYSGM